MLSWRAARPLLVRVLDGGREDAVRVRGEEAPTRRQEDIILGSPIILCRPNFGWLT